MASLSIKNLSKLFGDKSSVIKDLNLEIHDGEFMVFVGPSGCGKTTLLRMIAGLEEITSGEIYFDADCVNDVAPALRGASMVFQSYALYPHMTVAENMSFALKLAGVDKVKQREAVEKAADILQIRPLLDRKPKTLSGGQRQRVAIGRAIVRNPKVFLFDEPLSNLDANLRVQMRVELARLHRELGTTMIYVTHDQVEAMTLGQRIVVFNAGKIEQVGTPLSLYNNPDNVFVAEFMGSPKMNIMEGVWIQNNGRAGVKISGAGILNIETLFKSEVAVKKVGVRPEHFYLDENKNGLCATVSLVEQLGDSVIVYLKLKGADKEVTLRVNQLTQSLQMNQEVFINCAAENLRLFDQHGKFIAPQA
jgi:multiple sugar transport system ATP-binding protein